MNAKSLARILRPLKRSIALMISKAFVLRVDDSEGRLRVQLHVLDQEIADLVEVCQPLGISSVPMPPDSSGAPEAVVGFVGGSRANGVVVALDDRRARPRNHAPGTTVIYTANGHVVMIGNPDGSLQLLATDISVVASGQLDLSGDGVSIDAGSGDVNIDGAAVQIRGTDWDGHNHNYTEPLHPSLTQPGVSGGVN